MTGLYFRFDTRDRGSPVIIGGEDHKTGQEEENESRYKRLKKTLEKTSPTTKLNHRWSGQLLGTVDGLPYIGQVAEYQFLATGFFWQWNDPWNVFRDAYSRPYYGKIQSMGRVFRA
ncbi:unnamed protein product [uncultured bacterium]|nr:unnamed protein product [uncultured bacterium]